MNHWNAQDEPIGPAMNALRDVSDVAAQVLPRYQIPSSLKRGVEGDMILSHRPFSGTDDGPDVLIIPPRLNLPFKQKIPQGSGSQLVDTSTTLDISTTSEELDALIPHSFQLQRHQKGHRDYVAIKRTHLVPTAEELISSFDGEPSSNGKYVVEELRSPSQQVWRIATQVWRIATIEVPKRPTLVPNVQLIGEMQGSGFEDRQWLVERNGQFIQLTELLYRVLEQINGERTLEEIATRVTEVTDWIVSPDNVERIVQSKLMPMGLARTADGLVEVRDGTRVPLGMQSVRILGPRIIDPITRVLQSLYWPPVFIAASIVIAVAHVWLYFIHGITASIRDALYTPGQLLLVLVIFLLASVFHEFGHASALRYGGGKVRGIGAGIYLVYPILYTDVTDSYRLSRWGRLRTDLGGFYFQFLFVLGILAVYFVTHQEFLLSFILLTDLDILSECSPLVRFDGYWALADFTGIPDLFSQMGPFLQRMSSQIPPFMRPILSIPPSTGSKVLKLKPWVKVIFLFYTIVATFGLPLLLFSLLIYEPTVMSTELGALLEQKAAFLQARINGDGTIMVLASLQGILLAVPLWGNGYIIHNLVKRLWNWSKVTMKRAITGAVFAAAFIALLAFLWMPQFPSFASLSAGGAVSEPVDGISCEAAMDGIEHIHAHLSIYVNGQPVTIPAGIGISTKSNCFYWLHTHPTDGVIHVEAPVHGTFTLGQFFGIWSQSTRTPIETDTSFLGYPLKGQQLVIWVSNNGQPAERYIANVGLPVQSAHQQLPDCSATNRCYVGNLRDLVLQSHELITIAYNSPNVTPIRYFNWAGL